MASDKPVVGAYIDLVGVRALARRSPTEYSSALDIFQTEVADHCTHLKESDARILFFSDSAFLQCRDLEKLLEFLGLLRYALALHGVYFKGAVRLGDLEPQRASELPAVKDSENADLRRQIVDGYYFGPNAVPTYGHQDALKGIGLWIDPIGLDKKVIARRTVESCFIKPEGAGSAESYLDLRVEPAHLIPGVLETFLNKFFLAKTESKRLGRLFISFLVTWVKSIRFETWDPAPIDEKDLVAILLDGGFVRMFGDVHGIEMVYYALLGSVWEQREHVPPKLLSEVRAYVRSRSRLIRQINAAPETILPRIVQEACLLELSSELMFGKAEERQARERIEATLPLARTFGEVAESLNEEDIPSPSGGVWYPQAVGALARKLGIANLLGAELERETLARIRELDSEGKNASEIAHTLNSEGRVTARRRRWDERAVATYMARAREQRR